MLGLLADENFNNNEVSRKVPLSLAIEEIHLLAICSVPGEWEGQVRYLPLR
jgi:hypothetical protein